MSNKSYQNNLFKRIIDLGRVTTADVDDLVRIWRVGSGDEKAITLANFVATVDADLGSGGSSLTELIEALQNQVDNLTFLDLTDTPSSYSGQGTKILTVKSDETGLEFIDFPTVTGGDEPAVKTTASADQTLPSGVLTILDYDSTLTNNATLIYSVGTDGRITVSDNGVFDITAGVVIEADALTALESAFLGIFRNGNLIAISSINTTIAAGASSGLSCSTQIALLSGDIIDCRALVTSVGGVAPGLARRLGTLLGANATQVNSLAIVKCISNGQSFLQLSDTPASYTGQAGLFPKVNSGETGLEFFNPLSLPLTGYTVGSNTALASTDTILGALGKVQGQINAKIGGTIASGQVAFGTGVNTVGGDSGFTYDSASDRFTISGAGLYGFNNNDFISIVNPHIYASGSGGTVEPFQVTGNLILAPRTNSSLSTYFVTNNGSNVNWRWRIISSGILESRESNSIIARTGSLSFRSDGGNGSLFFTPNGTGGVCVGPATSPTNTLDVNGTARIRTLSNATGDFVTASATGVLQKRTAAETLADIGGIGGTIASGQVAFGTGANTIGGNANFVWNNSSNFLNVLIGANQIARLGNGIGTLEGALQLYTSAGVENIRLRAGSISYINNTFGFGIGTTSPTNALDVAGQTRIRTINNGDGYFLTKNSNGIITASQSLYQLSTSVGIGLTTPSGGLHIRRDSLYNAEGNTSLIIDGGSVLGAVKLLIGVDTTNDVAYIESMQAATGWNKNLAIQAMGGLVGIATISPTNTLDVNGTARIRSLTGTTGYLPLLSSTGVMGQSVAYNADTGIVINGTTLPSGAVFSVNGLSYFTNYATAGAYDKLAIDFGENRGFGYDGSSNEIFVKGTTTVPVKIDTDAPTDSFNILSTGGIKMANIPSGTPVTALGLDSNNELVKSTAVSATSGTFTPVLTDSASGATFTTTAVGKYYKVGNRVDVYISFDISAITGTATGDIEITDLPFSIDYGLNSTIQLMLNYSPPTADRGVEYIVPLLSSGTSFKLSYINGNGFVLAGTLASSSDIILTASYITT